MNIEEQKKKEIEAPMVISEGNEVDSTVVAKNEEMLEAVEVGNEETLPDEKQDDGTKVHLKVASDAPWSERMWEVFSTFWYLGLVAFGGPQAHVAILRDHLVVQRDWLDEELFTELFAIGQGLPGPTSTQLVGQHGPCPRWTTGTIVGVLWNLPGLIDLTVCGILLAEFVDPTDPPFWLVTTHASPCFQSPGTNGSVI